MVHLHIMAVNVWTLLLEILAFTGLVCQAQYLKVAPSNVTAIQGNQTTLKCEVTNSSYLFSWSEYVTSSVGVDIFRNAPIFGPEDPDLKIEGKYNLVISNVEMEDGGIYGCKVFHMVSPAYASVVVLNTPSIMDPDLFESVMTTVSCSAAYGGPRPSNLHPDNRPTLRLYIDEVDTNLKPSLIDGHPPLDGQPFKPSILTVATNYTPQISHTGRVIRCTISTILPPVSYSATRTLDIRYSVRDIQIFPIKTNYKIGDVINCTAAGNPTPTISWNPILSPAPHNPGKVLTILSNLVGENKWKCVATNTVQGIQYIEKEITFIVENDPPVGAAPLSAMSSSFTTTLLLYATVLLLHSQD